MSYISINIDENIFLHIINVDENDIFHIISVNWLIVELYKIFIFYFIHDIDVN